MIRDTREDLLTVVVTFVVLFSIPHSSCAEWHDTYDFAAEQVLGYWSFDGSTEDLSGRAANGIPSEAISYVTGAMNQAAEISGVRIMMGDVCRVSDDFTVSAWAWSNTTGGSQTLFRRGSPFPSTVPYRLAYGGGATLGARSDTLVPATLDSISEPHTGEWFHVAMTYDGTTRSLYFNGVLDASDEPAGTVYSGIGILDIGYDPQYLSASSWDGSIDDLVVFDRGLLPEEVALLARDLNENGVADFWEPELFPTPTPTPRPTRTPTTVPILCDLLEEDFSDGIADDWDPQGGDWVVTDGEYRRTNAKPHLPQHTIYRGMLSSAWADYCFGCDFQIPSGTETSKTVITTAEVEFIFRYTDENNYYKLSLYLPLGEKTTGPTYKLRKIVHGTWGYLTDHVPFVMDPMISNHIDIEAVGESILIILNGSELYSGTDHRLSEGTIGLNSVCEMVGFDNVCVTALSHQAPTPTPTIPPMACDLLEEDFMDGVADDWDPQGGAWEIVDGYYRRGDAKPHLPKYSVYRGTGSSDWADYNFGCDFRNYACQKDSKNTPESEEIEFYFRYVDETNYYKLTFYCPLGKCTNCTFKLRKLVDGEWVYLTSHIPVNLDTGVTNRVNIEARGSRLSIFLNGRRLFRGADSSHMAGTIGLNSIGQLVGFTNVCVTAVDPLPYLDPPQNLRATPGADRITLDWDPNEEENLAGYNVYRSDWEEGEFEQINDVLVEGAQYVDVGLAVGERYCYKVTAVDTANRESAPAGPVCAIVGQLIAWTPDVFGSPGQIVRIPVNISNAGGVVDNGLNIELDARTCVASEMIQYVSWERTGLTSNFIYEGFEPNPGDIRLTTVSTSGFVLNGGGHMVDIYFRVPDDAQEGTCCTFGFNRDNLGVRLYTRENGLPVALDVDYTDTSRFCVTSEGQYQLGDIFPLCHDDGPDGVVDAGDVLMALAISVGRVDAATCPHILDAGDINGDGVIDAADVILITRLSVGLPVNPPEGGKSLYDYAEVMKDVPPEYVVRAGKVGLLPGGYVDVTVGVDNAAGIAGGDFQVNFDSVVTQLVSVEPGTLAEDFKVEANTDKAEEGVLKFSIARSTNLSAGGGTLATLRFRSGENAGRGTSTPLVLAGVKLARQHGEDVSWDTPVSVVNGRISICPPYDIDGDGTTNQGDLMLFGRQWLNPFEAEHLLEFVQEVE